MANQVDKVGLGVDLDGGQRVLAELKEIRAEMSAISSISGGRSIGSGSSGARDISEKTIRDQAREQSEIAHLRRMEKMNTDSTRAITDDEVQVYRNSTARKAEVRKRARLDEQRELLTIGELNRRINERGAKEVDNRIEKEQRGYARLRQMLDQNTAANRKAIVEEGQLREQQFQAYKASRTRAAYNMSTGPFSPLSETDPGLRGRLRAVRNDPAAINDPTTQQWRSEAATMLRAERIQRDTRRQFEKDEASRIEAESARRDDIQKRWNERAIRRANQHVSDIQEIERRADWRTGNAGPPPIFRSGAEPAYTRTNGRGSITTGGAGGFSGGGGPEGPQGPGGPNSPINQRLRDPEGLLNNRGFFTSADAVGRITRNILLYEVVSRASYGLVNYIQNSITAAKTTVEYANALRFATQQAGGNVGANERLADSLQSIGLSRQQGRAAVIEASRFAINDPDKTAALTTTVADIAAARGLGVDKTDELIEQLRRRESKFFKRVFGKTVETIYEEAATQQLEQNAYDRAIVPVGDLKSRKEQISALTQGMDDTAKEAAILNFILSQSSKFQGEAAERAETLAGRIDKIAAAFLNAQENVGLFITEAQPVNDIIDKLVGGSSLLDKLRPATLGRTGPGGSISVADANQYAIDKTTGFRANALQNVNDLAAPLVLGGLGVAGLGLIGRGQAQAQVRTTAFREATNRLLLEFDGNLQAAQNAALTEVKNLKPGMINSIKTGAKRLTIGMTDAAVNQVNNIVGSELPTSTGFRNTGTGFVRPSSLALPGEYGRLNGLQTTGRYAPYVTGSPYINNVTDRDIRDLNRVTSAAGITGGLAGGIIGASLGALVAEKLEVGPITATGLTIAGGVAGNAAGTFLGQTAASAFSQYIISKGGFLALAGLSAEGGALGGLSSVGGAAAGLTGLTGGTIGAGLLAGLGIGALVNYINPNDALSQEQRRADRQKAFDEASLKRERERDDAIKQGLVRYTDLLPSSPTFGKSLSEREARAAGGFELGFTSQFRRYREDILQGNDPLLKLNNQDQIDRRRLDIQSQLYTTYRNQREVLDDIEKIKKTDAYKSGDEQTLGTIRNLDRQVELYTELGKLTTVEEGLKEFGTTDPKYQNYLSDYRKRSQEIFQKGIEESRKQDEIDQRRRNEQVAQQGNALNKLRDAKQGSFRIVGEIAESITGPDNQYTKALAEQATLAERMQQQWGYLGQAAVDYFTKVEGRSLDRSILKADFALQQRVGDNFLQRGREADERNGPGLSRREQDYLNIQSLIVDKAKEIPDLWRQAAEVVGRQGVSVTDELTGRINLINRAFGVQGVTQYNRLGQDITNRDNRQYNALGQYIGDTFGYQPRVNALGQSLENPEIAQIFSSVGAGQSPQVREALQRSFADTLIDSFKNFSPAQIRSSGQADLYLGALRFKSSDSSLINDAIKKAELGAREDVRLKEQLAADNENRRRLILNGANAQDVGRESDALLLARTNGISPKDLTFDQFQARQDALRRTAERDVQDRAEAKAAVAKGLEYQGQMASEIAAIRQAILNGDISMLIQVQNDTQARVDQEALQRNQGPGYNVPLDQGGARSNPYTSATDRYGRGGRRR